MNNKYFLLRHGQTIYQTKKKGFLYPWPEIAPISLTKKGEGQIEKAAKDLKKENIDLIYSSDVFRAKQTAGIVGKEFGLKVNFDKRLRDVNCGIFNGKHEKNLQRFFSSEMEKFSKKIPKGENWNDVRKRLTDFIEEVKRKYTDKKILIISHGDPLWFLAGIIKGLKSEEEFLKPEHKLFYPQVGQLIKIWL